MKEELLPSMLLPVPLLLYSSLDPRLRYYDSFIYACFTGKKYKEGFGMHTEMG